MVISIAAALLIFKDLGLCDAVIQWPSITHRQISTLFWVNVAVGFGITVVLMAVSPVIAWFYGEPSLIGIGVGWSLVFVIGGFSAQHLALLKRGMFFHGVSVLTLAAAVVSNCVAIFLAWHGASYWCLVLREVLFEVLMAGGAWFLCAWRPGFPARPSYIRPMLTFGGHTILSFIIRRSVRNLDRILIGWQFGAQAVGYYHKAFELAALPASQISDSLRNVAVSALSKLREEPEMYRRYYLKAIRTISFLGFAATAFIVVISDDLFLLILGPQWKEAGRILGILGLSAGMFMIYLTHVWLHFSLGRADRLAQWSGIEAVVTISAITIGLYFGVAGVAWAYTLAISILTVWGIRFAGRPIGLKVSEILEATWRCIVAATGAASASWYLVIDSALFSGHLSRILAAGICLVMVYVALTLILYRSLLPINELWSMLGKFLRRERPVKNLQKPAFENDF